ncbi:hypothetical protein CANCADRAFT_108019 [Tortispora caseinolytica NRRL Y-17796]|uniref:DUF1682-domain-containing protein n=1 Tax=Tortispora caseinolytica NRRL Y-17796 TaxID=767744 RepID=A0A1E4TFQ1_9ASCO|nr:hypothetical protein CANCADRAFT_108019 [Tortispora caseinolytica NRRL Y-17796]
MASLLKYFRFDDFVALDEKTREIVGRFHYNLMSQAIPLELYNLPFKQRMSYYNWKYEIYIMTALIVYFIMYYIGKTMNKNIAEKVINKVIPVLREQFAHVGVGPIGGEEKLIRYGSSNRYITYGSGRLNVRSITVDVSLKNRQALPMLLLEYVLAFAFGMELPRDKVDVNIVLSEAARSKVQGFIFGVISKLQMKQMRDESYALSLTKTVDYPEDASLVIMSEQAEITSVVLPPIKNAIKAAAPILDVLSVADMPVQKPTSTSAFDKSVNHRTITLVTGTGDPEALAELINAVIEWVDFLSDVEFRADVVKKLKSVRDGERVKLKKAEDEQKAEEIATQLAADKAKARREKMSKMSPEEQRKFLQKENAKASKKKQKMIR